MDLFLSFVKEVALAFFKVIVTDIAKSIVTRLKERTAPTDDRDGSDFLHR